MLATLMRLSARLVVTPASFAAVCAFARYRKSSCSEPILVNVVHFVKCWSMLFNEGKEMRAGKDADEEKEGKMGGGRGYLVHPRNTQVPA